MTSLFYFERDDHTKMEARLGKFPVIPLFAYIFDEEKIIKKELKAVLRMFSG